MRILSDFDGVLTDQTAEAQRARELFRGRLIELTGLSAEETDSLIDHGESAMNAAPEQHGWRADGRITAFADEDLFIRNNGLAGCFDGWAADGHANMGELLAALTAAGLEDFTALASWAYREMVGETRAGLLEPIDPATADVIRELLGDGHDIVVVSNSGTDRISDLLTRAGLSPARHEDDPSAPLRVRGNARKFELGDVSAGFDVGAYFVETARPTYEAILREERAGAVIGDVFSLDLALPLQLARSEPETFGGTTLLLRTRDYTPGWARGFCSGADEPHARLAVLEALPDLPGLLG